MNRFTTPQPSRHNSPTTRAQKLAYLKFECQDLDRAERFLTDFGLSVALRTPELLYMRTADSEPFCYVAKKSDKSAFTGFGLHVASRSDLIKLSHLDEASALTWTTQPGGGEIVQLQDPSGFIVDAIYGQEPVPTLTHRPALSFNFEQKMERINNTQRPPVSVPEVLKLGHVVMEVAKFQQSCGWYTRHFGFIPSDVQLLPDATPAVVFLRLDLGDTPTDHHTLAIAQGFMPAYSHSAFELVDADAVGMGQRILRERGWRHAWGIGRHILGSQIFDYWQDSWGNKFEHYCDGDLFTADVEMGIHPVSREAMSQWGQPMPRSFTKPKMTPKAIRALIHNVRYSPDLSVRKLISLAKIFT